MANVILWSDMASTYKIVKAFEKIENVTDKKTFAGTDQAT